MKRRAIVVAAVLLASAAYAPFGLPITSAALAAQEPDWNELSRMEEAGAEAFNRAGDTDLSRKRRNEAIVEAYGLLKRVYKVLDAHCDAHPDQIEALDERMVNINMMVFWLKKDAPVSLMPAMHAAARGERSATSGSGTGAGTGPAPDKPDDTGGSTRGSGIGGSSRQDDPPPTPPKPPPAEDDAGSDAEPAGGPPTALPTGPPSGPAPAVPAQPQRPPLEIARAHEKGKPSDVAGALELWLDVLVVHEDTTSAAYVEALGRVSELSARLKNFYRVRRDEDPDAVARDENAGREASVAGRLSTGLNSDAPEERRAAADQLASLGWTPAALAIQSALRREKDAGVRDAMFLALVRLGGSRTCDSLARFARERNDELALGAVRSLAALARKGPVEARYAGVSLGAFVASAKSAAASPEALGVLQTMSGAGVPGLVIGIETKDRDLELAVIAAMGTARDGRSAAALAARLTEKVDEDVRRASMKAIASIGRPSVPALIEALKKKKTRRYSAIALYEITSQPHGEDAKAWLKWWRAEGEK